MKISKRGFFKVIAGGLGYIAMAAIIPSGVVLASNPDGNPPVSIRKHGAFEELKCDHWNLKARIINEETDKPMLSGYAHPHDKFYPKESFAYHIDPEKYRTDEDYKRRCLNEVNEALAGAYKKYKAKYFKLHV